jgi:hypothetical protein
VQHEGPFYLLKDIRSQKVDTLEHAMKAQMGISGLAVIFL